jgi:signal transduction histidine kinase
MSVWASERHGPRWAAPALSAWIAWTVAGIALGLVGVVALVRVVSPQAGGGEVPAEIRDWLLALLCVPLGARIAAHRPHNPCGWLVLAVGTLAAATVATATLPSGTGTWLRDWLWWPGYGLLVLIALLFPDGHPVSPRWRWITRALVGSTAVGTIALASLSARAPDLLSGTTAISPGLDTIAFLAATAVLVLGAFAAVVSLAVRIVRTPPGARGLLVWAVVNAAILLVALLLDTFAGVPLIWLLGALAVPVAAVIGVLRYGLYAIEFLVHRTLAYGLASAALLLCYPLILLALGGSTSEPATVAAIVVLVVASLPVRAGANRIVHQWLYGLSARPYELLDTLGRRVVATQLPEQVLAEAVSTIGEALKLPFVQARLAGQTAAEATFGDRRPWSVTSLELGYQGQVFGELLVQQRSPDEPWSRREKKLLVGLATQLGPGAASVRLTRELQAARQRLVRTREEELRRLQHDLHDGIGAALTGSRMTARAARSRTQEPQVEVLLARLEEDLADAGTQLRRIIDGLRPPALDRGLVEALEVAARRHRRPDLDVAVHVDALPPIPAAVEVAAYRLVEEALVNVVKHAGAAQAEVSVTSTPVTLHVEVADDGIGPGLSGPGGVGWESMRERCQELGGSWTISATDPGTRVTATIPLT